MKETSEVCQSNPPSQCIYNGISEKCRLGSHEDLSEEACQGEFNHNMYAWVAGTCVINPCVENSCGTVIKEGCFLESGRCVVDECMKHTSEVCEVYPQMANCIWDGEHGICRVGTVESLSESACKAEYNHNWYAWVAGKCVENPCIGCESNIIPGCSLINELCVVDECVKYSEDECKSGVLKNCVVREVGNERRCVVGTCITLTNSDDCGYNEPNCIIVEGVCSEYPCSDSECVSQACKMKAIEDGEFQCIFDDCARYNYAGLR
jgi:hypothetical protein